MVPSWLSSVLLVSFSVAIAGSAIRKDYLYLDEAQSNEGRHGIIQGDILLTEDQKGEMVEEGGKRAKRQITRIWKKWPNNIVYYYFDSSVSTLKQQLFGTAFDYISSLTCITFKQSSTATNRLKILGTGGCASYIGMNGGEQVLWFGDGCEIFGTAVHEVMHTLGVFHTHSRYDRNDYLLVNLTGVPDDMMANLDMETKSTTYNAVPFEYGSAMMYRQNTWGDTTLYPDDGLYQKTMGLRKVSFYDVVNVNNRYSCGCSNTLNCKNGGYINPSTCNSCVCPAGYGGTYCDSAPENSRTLVAESSWKGFYLKFGYKTEILTTNFYKAALFVTAPADKTIQIKIVEMSNFTCAYGCNYNGVEIKYHGDPRLINPVFCCEQDEGAMNQVYTSKLNPTPVVLHQRFGSSRITINYRYIDTPLSSNKLVTNGYDNYQYYE